MLDKRKELILKFVSKKIDIDFFLKEYDLKSNFRTHIVKTLMNSKDTESADDIEHILLLYFNLNKIELNILDVELLCSLLLERWHQSHEDLVMIIDKFKSFKSIDCLEKAIYLNLEYLDYNDSASLIRKCTFALGNINHDKAREKLKQLSKSKNLIIKASAKEQLCRKGI